MSSLSYTPDPKTLPTYDVKEKQISKKELRKIEIWYRRGPRFNDRGYELIVPIEKMGIPHLRRGKLISFLRMNNIDATSTGIVGGIWKRHGMVLTVFTFNGLYVITLRPQHLDWENYQAKRAERHYRMLKKKIRNKNLKHFLSKAEEKVLNWSKSELIFKESYLNERIHNDRISCNISPRLTPLSHKLVKLLKIAHKLKFSN